MPSQEPNRDDEWEALAEAAYPSAPFYDTGTNPWPQSFRTAFTKGWDACNRSRNKVETLGDIANVLGDMKDGGVTRAAILYTLDQVYWEDAG